MESVNEKMSISLYLKEEYSDVSVEVSSLMKDIQKVNTSIQVEYKNKEAILEDMRKKEPKLVKILEKNNPLPNTIVLWWIDLQDYESVNSLIQNKMFILSNDKNKDSFSNYTTQYKRIKDVITVLDVLKNWLIITIVIFFASIAVISYSVISNFIYYYRDEIYITKLVGGAKNFIYGPFVVQGVIYALVSFLLNLWVLKMLLSYLEVVFTSYGVEVLSVSPKILWGELVIFILIGAISGYFSSIGHIKNHFKK